MIFGPKTMEQIVCRDEEADSQNLECQERLAAAGKSEPVNVKHLP